MSTVTFGYCPDSYALLAAGGAGKVDVILTDPPYEKHVQENMYAGGNAGTQFAYAYEVAAGFAPLASYAWVPSALDKVRRWAIFFCGLEQLGYYRDAMGARWLRSGIYSKIRAQPQLTADRPGNSCEGIAIAHGADVKKRWNGKGSHAFWDALDEDFTVRCMPENRSATRHPTAKPLMLCMRLVELFTEPGELVFDPFCGTGNIGIACGLLGRTYVGLDNDPKHLHNAKDRYDQAARDRHKLLAKFDAWKVKRDEDEAQLAKRLAVIG